LAGHDAQLVDDPEHVTQELSQKRQLELLAYEPAGQDPTQVEL